MKTENDKTTRWTSEVNTSDILHSLPDAVFTTDHQMRINYFNKAASTITGFKPNEAIGMYCRDVMKTDICDTECPIKQALDSNQNIFNIETNITTVHGEKLTILISATILASPAGDILAYMHVFRDISPIKKMVFELKTSRNKLARKNRQLAQVIRELKSTQEQLVQAQKMESLGTLAGGIAHDFNNLLSVILGYASLLKMKINRDSSLYNYANTIEEAAVKTSKLTQQLLTFSRRGTSQLETIDINQVIKDALHIVENTIAKTIHIESSLSPDLKNVEADTSQIEQVLLNMFINACDAMPDGGTLTISSENTPAFNGSRHKEYVKISISDTGKGIPKEIQGRIFDPFFSTKEKGKGTGLGLSMAYGIIKNHKGHINVKSMPGEGSTFEIFLPISDKIKSLVKHGSESKTSKGKETILLVEDEDAVRIMAKEALTQSGYAVLTASNGIEAIEQYKRHGDYIDLVILDMIMPEMNGIETYKQLKKLNPSLKIIISSGYSDKEQDLSIIQGEIEGFLVKPYKVNELAQAVRNVLDKQFPAPATKDEDYSHEEAGSKLNEEAKGPFD